MGSLYDQIPGYREAVARETVGRDAAYLALPRLVAGVALRPLTLRDYLRLSVEGSPFVAGGKPGRDDVCFLLWHQRAENLDGEDHRAFAARFDQVDLALLSAACGEYVSQALVDAPQGSGSRKGAYFGIAARLIRTFRHEYPGMTRDEVLDTPLDQLWQEDRAITQAHYPTALLFNRSDRLKSEYAARFNQPAAPAAEPPPKRRRPRPRA